MHDNVRHTANFTVVGDHLAQHPDPSLPAIGLGLHIQSVRGGTSVDIKSLRPSCTAPALLRAATDLLTDLRRHASRLLLTDLRRHASRLLLSATDTAHLVPGVAAWLERDVRPSAVRHALTADLPDEPLRRPAALLAHRLAAQLPPPAPYRPVASVPPRPRHPLRNCDGCDRGFRGPETERHCRGCRTAAAPHP
ncbi:hypothetical protein [Streptomyces sp. NPDC055794]